MKSKRKQKNGQIRATTQERSLSSKILAAKPLDSGLLTANASGEQVPSKKLIVFTSIEELPMDRFIDCTCDDNLSRLIIEGEATPEELKAAWINIKSQHLENMNDAKTNIYIINGIEFNGFQLKRIAVECLLYLLDNDGPNDEVIELLEVEGYDYPFTEDTYKDDIIRVRAELGSESLDVESYLLDSSQTAEKPTKQVFYNTILSLQKHLGLCAGVTPMKAAKELTVFEFGSYCKEFNKMAKAANTKEDVTA